MSRKSRGPKNHQIQQYQQRDPFQNMHQIMMQGFGGFQNDPFFSRDVMRPFKDPFEDMFKFSDIHQSIHGKAKQGSFVSQTFVSSSKMGPDGKVHRQDYFQNNMGQHKGGNTISQKHQAYKNNKGVNRIAEQRMLNDKGRKMVREKRGNQIEETNHYFNIDEEEGHQFNNDWRQVNERTNFLDRHQKHLQIGHHQRPVQQITYEQPKYKSSNKHVSRKR